MNLKIYMTRLAHRKALLMLSILLVVFTATAQEQETGTVIFFRKLSTSAVLEGFKMYYNDSIYVGNIKNGRYLVFQCPAGTASFTDKPGKRNNKEELTIEPGQTYYIECSLSNSFISQEMGSWRSKLFYEVKKEKGERVVKRLKEAKPTDVGPNENSVE